MVAAVVVVVVAAAVGTVEAVVDVLLDVDIHVAVDPDVPCAVLEVDTLHLPCVLVVVEVE